MADLSPAAQAVLDAAVLPCTIRQGIAAALRALAEQMPNSYPASLEQMPEDARRWYRLGFGAAGNCDRSWLSAIAAELEGADG
jgi:hypothetical protein